jgi:hypothetical protein
MPSENALANHKRRILGYAGDVVGLYSAPFSTWQALYVLPGWESRGEGTPEVEGDLTNPLIPRVCLYLQKRYTICGFDEWRRFRFFCHFLFMRYNSKA